ncbi:MAG: efflux RND transporter periplasmic adaptor subunit, partial [Geminicoccaceae bacterium]
MKQVLISILLLLAFAGGGYWYLQQDAAGKGGSNGAGQSRPPLRVEVRTPERKVLAERIEAVGTTLANQAIDVVPLTSGRVGAVEFEPGSLVEAGEILARLEAVAERADVAEAEANLNQAKLAFERSSRLRADNTVARATLDQLEASYRAAEARLDRARKELSDRLIRAPFAGRTGLRQIDVGARVSDGSIITTLDDLSEVEIDFSVPEIFFGAVRHGQKVNAMATAFGDRTFEGTIKAIGSRIDTASRSFRVRAAVPNPDLILPAGMFMHVELILAEDEQLTVPEEALMIQGEATYVFVIVDGKAARREVKIGQRELGLV